MSRILSSFLCMLWVVYATGEFSDFYLCSNGIEDDDGVQTSDRPNLCVPVYSADKPLEEMSQNRRKRSLEQAVESWPVIRVHRGREIIKTVHLPSSFTPRLGRRRAGFRIVGDSPHHVINLNAGSAFTPRLGRQVQNS